MDRRNRGRAGDSPNVGAAGMNEPQRLSESVKRVGSRIVDSAVDENRLRLDTDHAGVDFDQTAGRQSPGSQVSFGITFAQFLRRVPLWPHLLRSS